MTNFVLVNNASTTLAAAAASGATTLSIASATNFPSSLTGGQVLPLTLNDAATRQIYEIVYVTAITGTTLTVLRGQEGTTAQNWNIGDFSFVAFTAGVLTSLGLGQTGIAGQASGLTISNDGTSPNTKRNIAATSLVVSGGGATSLLTSVAVSISSAASGAGGLDTGTLAANQVYYEYVIAQPGGLVPTGLMSLSPTAPTMPAGYTMLARVGGGAITDASKNFYRINEVGRIGWYVLTPTTNTAALPTIASGSNSGVFTAASTAAFVPAVAIKARYAVQIATGTNGGAFLAPNNNYAANPYPATPGQLAPLISDFNLAAISGSGTIASYGEIPFETASTVYYAATVSANAFVYGWEMPQ